MSGTQPQQLYAYVGAHHRVGLGGLIIAAAVLSTKFEHIPTSGVKRAIYNDTGTRRRTQISHEPT